MHLKMAAILHEPQCVNMGAQEIPAHIVQCLMIHFNIPSTTLPVPSAFGAYSSVYFTTKTVYDKMTILYNKLYLEIKILFILKLFRIWHIISFY